MKRHIKRTLILIAGILSILVGLAGLVLPILQGWFFLAVGVVLLSLYSPELRERVSGYLSRFPKLHERFERLDDWARRTIGE